MLPRQHRLELRSFPDFFATSNVKHSKFFSCYWRRVTAEKPELEVFQLSLVVSKKTAPLSVDRHRLKRQVTELCWKRIQATPTLKPLQVVLVVKANIVHQEKDMVVADLERLLTSL